MFLLDVWVLLKTKDDFKLGAQDLLLYVGPRVAPYPGPGSARCIRSLCRGHLHSISLRELAPAPDLLVARK